jgi:hypothetical protein
MSVHLGSLCARLIEAVDIGCGEVRSENSIRSCWRKSTKPRLRDSPDREENISEWHRCYSMRHRSTHPDVNSLLGRQHEKCPCCLHARCCLPSASYSIDPRRTSALRHSHRLSTMPGNLPSGPQPREKKRQSRSPLRPCAERRSRRPSLIDAQSRARVSAAMFGVPGGCRQTGRNEQLLLTPVSPKGNRSKVEPWPGF